MCVNSLLLALLVILLASTCLAAPVTVYVSPTGNDAASGLKPDQPVATITKAMEIARAARCTASEGYKVVLRGGTHYLPATVAFTAADSGTAQAPTQLVAFKGERVRLVAGRDLRRGRASAGPDGWKPWKGGILQLDLKPLGLEGKLFRQLFYNGERLPMARTPNFDPADKHAGKWAYVEAAVEKDSRRVFRYAPGDMKPWQDLSQAEVFFFHSYNYYNTIVPLVSVDADRRLARLGQDTYDIIRGEGAERYYVQNVLEELDAPGEWYLDRKTSILYLYPPAGGAFDQASIEVPLAEHVISLDNASHVTIQGLALEVSEGGAVDLHDCTCCRVVACSVGHCGVGTQIGGWGPWEDQCGIGIFGGKDNGAVGNDIYDTGSHGVKLTGGDRKTLTPAGNFAENNHIRHTGVYWAQGCGARLEGVGNRFSRNTVHDIPRMGVIFSGNDNLIEFNHLYDLNRQTCDTGAIYTGGRNWLDPWGSKIQYNYIHDIGGYGREDGKWVSPAFSWGIYLDDNSNGCNVIGNIVVGGYWGGIHLHNAHDSTIENNIIVDGVQQQAQFSGWVKGSGSWANSLESWMKYWNEYKQYPAWRKYPGFVETSPADLVPMSNNRLQRNIFAYSGEKSALYAFRSLPLDKTLFDYNVIWHHDLPLKLGLQRLLQVQVAPDAHEMLANGGFEEGKVGEMPAKWTWMIRPDARAKAVLTEETAHSGVRSMRVDASTAKDAGGNLQNTFVRTDEFAVQAGQAYRLTAWVKGGRAGLPLGLVAQSYKAQKHHWAMERSFTVGEEWQQYTLDFYIPGPKDADYKPTLDNLWIRLDFRHDGGVYWVDDVSLKPGSNPLETKTEWQVWQEQGQDVHSVVADLLFVAPEKGDYRLKPNSPALKLGFKQIPVEKIGCYRSEERATWPLEAAR
ncbi:MAG: right-handed parallel beta-helix repeat-containing protein [Armatimonadia bacterium]